MQKKKKKPEKNKNNNIFSQLFLVQPHQPLLHARKFHLEKSESPSTSMASTGRYTWYNALL